MRAIVSKNIKYKAGVNPWAYEMLGTGTKQKHINTVTYASAALDCSVRKRAIDGRFRNTHAKVLCIIAPYSAV